MIIPCEECNASFNLDERLLKPTGSKVRCSKCSHIFVAYPPPAPETADGPDILAGDGVMSGDAAESAAEETELATDDLDLSDLGLDDADEAPAEEPVEDFSSDELDAELDMSDLDLGEDEEPAIAEETASDAGEAEAELDLSDLNLDFEGDADAGAEEDDLGLDLEADGVEPEAETDDLDLSDLNLELEDATEAGADDLGLELEPEAGAPEAEADDLELDLDMEGEAVAGTGEDAADEFDISDLESVLDDDDAEPAADEDVDDVELEFDMVPAEDAEIAELELDGEAEELDLSELETMLDTPEDAAVAAEAGDDDLDLDMEMDFDLETPEADAGDEGEAFEMEFGEETPDDFDELEAVEDLEGEPLDDDAPGTFAETMDMETFEREAAAAEEAAGAAPGKPVKVKKKKRRSKSVLVILILILLLGGAYGAYTVLDGMGIRIPYVSDLISPQMDQGQIEVIQGTVRSKFVENGKAGKLFVITGRARNGFKQPRNFISVTGKLFSKGKAPVNTQTVFCGNTLSGLDLANMELAGITKRLRNRVGDKRSNMNVGPGTTVPFMIVFSNLPAELTEFTVEAGSSTAAQ
jgi:predicted Zn finger-like uncharacterized protein